LERLGQHHGRVDDHHHPGHDLLRHRAAAPVGRPGVRGCGGLTDPLVRLAHSVLWPGVPGTEPPAGLLAALRDDRAAVGCVAQTVGPRRPELSAALQAANPHALIGIDEEGGSVTRLEAATGSTLPGAAQLGVVDDVEASTATGAEL